MNQVKILFENWRGFMGEGPNDGPLQPLPCREERNFWSMKLADDEFIHFTIESRAREIIEVGKLLMKPPYKKFGIDTITAVSSVWGVYLPDVQITHTKQSGDDRIVAIKFKTSTQPKFGSLEEVIWETDVSLQNAEIIPAEQAIKMLRPASDELFDKIETVWYEVPAFCEEE
jgi:hypothetical protein